MKLTVKLAKETVKASYPRAVCRVGWRAVNGVRQDFAEIMPDLRISGDFIGSRYRAPVVLGKALTRSEAWKVAAQKLIDAVRP